MAFNITPQAILGNAASALNLLTEGLKTDVVAVYNQEDFQQVFSGARPVKANVRETARVMDYPVETGVTLSDHLVVMPTEIEIMFFIRSDAYASAYQQMRNLWLTATLLSVQTRTGSYRNMIISDLPHDEDPEMSDAIMLGLRMREVIFVPPNSVAARQNEVPSYSPAEPTDSSTVLRGQMSQAVTLAGSILSYINAGSVWGVNL